MSNYYDRDFARFKGLVDGLPEDEIREMVQDWISFHPVETAYSMLRYKETAAILHFAKRSDDGLSPGETDFLAEVGRLVDILEGNPEEAVMDKTFYDLSSLLCSEWRWILEKSDMAREPMEDGPRPS